MSQLRDKARKILFANTAKTNKSYGSTYYRNVNKDLQAELPELFEKAKEIASTVSFNTYRGTRTLHYMGFDLMATDLVENQQQAVDAYYEGGTSLSTPFQGRKPSVNEILFTAFWCIIGVLEASEEAVRKTA